ncbi:hypothetical protein LCGC14_2841560 [marine sediment metagenome]|uniref:Uncharacterized protein n=1 Tax=marine sediment metagenome TaxID=412755 RepID=A0A0F8YXS2_9ZZZZ
MAISARIPAGVDNAGFVPELWSVNVLDAVKNNLVIVPIVDHTWEPELTKGDTMNVGVLNTVTATEVTIGTEGVIQDIASGTKKQIIIDQYFEAPVVLDDMTNLQSQVSLRGKAEIESAYAIAKKMDSTLADLFDNLDNAAGTDGSAITDDVLILAVETLDEADVPGDQRVWVFDPSCKADLLKITKFVSVDFVRSTVVPTGKFGDIYGAPIFITNNLTVNSTGNDGAYLHKEALAIIAQEKMRGDFVRQPLKHQITINTTALWGVKEMRGTFGVHIKTRKS